MLLYLLTLLPYQASQKEVAYHKQFILRAYRDFYHTILTTSYKDRARLRRMREMVSYSVRIVKKYDSKFIKQIRLVDRGLNKLPVVNKLGKPLIPLPTP